MLSQLGGEVERLLSEFLRDKVANVLASFIYGAYAGGYADERSAIDILAIINSRRTALKCWSERLIDKRVRILAIDRGSFESDVENESFGGIFSENLVTPYKPIIGVDYLKSQEIKLKRNIIEGILRNLVIGFPEMSRSFLIKPEYFMYEYLVRRSTLFPQISYRFLNFLEDEKNISTMMEGFKTAISELIQSGVIQETEEGFLKISENYIRRVGRRRGQLTRLFSTVRNNIVRYMLGIFPEIRESFLDEIRIYRARHSKDRPMSPLRVLGDPRRYILIPTALGKIPFTEKLSIKDFIAKRAPERSAAKCYMKRLGGVLNNVYLLKFSDGGKEENLVAKIFKDWYGWKWFPIALWALGARNFAVLGKTRLEKEYSMNRLLSSHGINVPIIVYANPEEKIIIQEHVEGHTASKLIRQVCRATSEEEKKRLLEVIRQIGCEVARVHGLGVSIGDCSPENILVSHDGKIFFVDLEQAESGGDQAWDIAEFLYYSGHYILLPTDVAEEVAREFISGYIAAGGRIENVRRALSLKYIRVFSFFTPPHIILAIVGSCKNLLKSLGYE